MGSKGLFYTYMLGGAADVSKAMMALHNVIDPKVSSIFSRPEDFWDTVGRYTGDF